LLQKRHEYVDAVVEELRQRRTFLVDEPVDTIYFGGGTPSQLPPDELERILVSIYNIYNVRENAEVTLEGNPDDMTPPLLYRLLQMGINRLSMGIQTFDEARLHFLHRRHTATQAIQAVHDAQDAGFSNISIDLMFGFPGETLSQWQSDIRHAISLQPQHISAYSLMYEEGTPLHRMLTEGKIEETDEDLSLQMFETLVSQLTAAGYEHYEISNFALPSFRSRHNSAYWHNVPYIGLGAAAHSYDLRSRSWNIADVKEYIRIIGTGKRPVEDSETIDADTHYNDIVTTAMRTREGIPLDVLTPEQRRYLLDAAQKMAERGLLNISDTHVSLTHNGVFVSNSVMAELIKA
jgi:oxygen-independent coproporphyrinogen-3 oxidase